MTTNRWIEYKSEAQVCPYCKTKNLHYNLFTKMWLCAYCGRGMFNTDGK